jgi:ribose/xylose/arabinose/galactoside ABC-type transport system permease subunit
MNMHVGLSRQTFVRVWTAIGPFLGLLAVTAFFVWQTRHSGTFLSAVTWRTILVQTVIVGIAALGMTIVMISGGIDLSIGSAVALITVVIADFAGGFQFSCDFLGQPSWSFHVPAIPVALAIVIGILAGGLCGLLNGGLITRLGVVPFIITLGTLKILRGLAKWFSGSTMVNLPSESKPEWLGHLLSTEAPQPSWLLFAPGVWVLLGLALLVALMLRYSVLGRYVYAVGSSEPTARLCGIDVPKVKLGVYVLAGLLTGLAGVMEFAYLSGAGDPTCADGLELQVIAAVVIGGGSLSGGEGTVLGTLIGCLFITILDAGCSHVGYPAATRDVIIGAIIVTAVAIDRFRKTAA